MSDIELVERLCLAALLGAVLGFEREWRQKNAGLKTNILIAMGSALFTLMSIDLSKSAGGDATRIAAQIVTGIGFLGAGAIMQTGVGISGLTTAAMIWVNAAIGVACGGGEYRLAMIATAVTLAVMLVITPLEKALDRHLKNRNNNQNEDNDDQAATREKQPQTTQTTQKPQTTQKTHTAQKTQTALTSPATQDGTAERQPEAGVRRRDART